MPGSRSQDAKFSGTLALISSQMIYGRGNYTVSHHCPELCNWQYIDKIDLRYSVKHCSKEASLNVSILAAAPCIHRWLSGSGLEEPGFVSAIKSPSPPAATPSSSQWSSARSESWPRLPIKCHQLSPSRLLSAARVRWKYELSIKKMMRSKQGGCWCWCHPSWSILFRLH